MCILSKLDFAKFGVCNVRKVIKEKPLGSRLDPPLVKERLISSCVLTYNFRRKLNIRLSIYCNEIITVTIIFNFW